MCQEKNEIAGKVHTIIDKFAERGLRSLAVALQVVKEQEIPRSILKCSLPWDALEQQFLEILLLKW